jgi:hypothetical protein
MEVSKLEEVPDNSPAVYSSCTVHDPNGSDDLRVGCDSIPLCSIFPVIEGKLMVECILDSGCQIVAMNNIIWEKPGNNLQVEQALNMEATNSTVTEMHSCLHNIHFTFNDIDIYLQSVLFKFPLARQVLCTSFTLIYIFTLDFPWLGLSGVFSLE